MAPYNSDNRILGIHMLRVLRESRAVVSKLAGVGGAKKHVGNGMLNPELEDLEKAVNALAQFEREASVRGTVKALEASEISSAIDAARGVLDASREVRDALNMSDKEAEDLFSLGAEQREEAPAAPRSGGAAPATEGTGEDPFAIG